VEAKCNAQKHVVRLYLDREDVYGKRPLPVDLTCTAGLQLLDALQRQRADMVIGQQRAWEEQRDQIQSEIGMLMRKLEVLEANVPSATQLPPAAQVPQLPAIVAHEKGSAATPTPARPATRDRAPSTKG
jgi:hypothetical protein